MLEVKPANTSSVDEFQESAHMATPSEQISANSRLVSAGNGQRRDEQLNIQDPEEEVKGDSFAESEDLSDSEASVAIPEGES